MGTKKGWEGDKGGKYRKAKIIKERNRMRGKRKRSIRKKKRRERKENEGRCGRKLINQGEMSG